MNKKRRFINEDNPLVVYKRKNKKEWKDLAAETGLCERTLIRIAMKDKDRVGNNSYNTIVKIRETIGVDIINDWK